MGILWLLWAASAGANMLPPRAAGEVQARALAPGLAGLSGGGLGGRLSVRYAMRDRLMAGSSAVSNPSGERVETLSFAAVGDWEFVPRWTAVAVVPYSSNRFRSAAGDVDVRGVGDVTFLVRWAALKRPGAEWGLVAGVKAPTGAVDAASGGRVLPSTQQPGTGTADFIAAASGAVERGPTLVYGSAAYKYNTKDSYTFGNQLSADLGATWGAARAFRLSAELGLEASERDHAIERAPGVAPDGSVRDTGGWSLSATPGLEWSPSRDWTLAASVRLPVCQYLNGVQLAAGPTFALETRVRFRRR
ncbi:MAG: hypothetical protein HY925_13115 [Elusimicrobia bacterium]|nr:hypothetical protein [Elusimicrobiota bacterium]